MPQGKRKYSRCDPKVLGSKDLKKIQKLVHHLSDEEDECKNSSTNPEHDPEVYFELCITVFQDVDELTQEWKNFYKPGAADDDDYLIKYQSNLKSCHSEVSEAMSQFAGSLPGDLEAFDESADLEDLPVEIQDHLRLLTDVLKHYRSGPLPKTVKMLPHLPGWANILKILNPLQWTVHAYQRVVKVFASKGGEQALV
ncbi:unnamed protein product [Protopolystoma xenopodis]|uniref:Uncharacterized protein n=1 Tax=Protopolystoma xenopodis TaxID=117903 RepID=A0A3S5CL65_9PLAT|nr:unnamed protein product [Protopolystoma xenopodis]